MGRLVIFMQILAINITFIYYLLFKNIGQQKRMNTHQKGKKYQSNSFQILQLPPKNSFVLVQAPNCEYTLYRLPDKKIHVEAYKIALGKNKIYEYRNNTQFPIPKCYYLNVKQKPSSPGQTNNLIQNSQHSARTPPSPSSPSVHSETTQIVVYIEHCPTKLSTLTNLPLHHCIYILKQASIGFERLAKKFGCFYIYDTMIRFNQKGFCRVWIHDNFGTNQVAKLRGASSKDYRDDLEANWAQPKYNYLAQIDMVQDLVTVVQKHTQQTVSTQKLFQNLRSCKSFLQVLKKVQTFSSQAKTQIVTKFSQISSSSTLSPDSSPLSPKRKPKLNLLTKVQSVREGRTSGIMDVSDNEAKDNSSFNGSLNGKYNSVYPVTSLFGNKNSCGPSNQNSRINQSISTEKNAYKIHENPQICNEHNSYQIKYNTQIKKIKSQENLGIGLFGNSASHNIANQNSLSPAKLNLFANTQDRQRMKKSNGQIGFSSGSMEYTNCFGTEGRKIQLRQIETNPIKCSNSTNTNTNISGNNQLSPKSKHELKLNSINRITLKSQEKYINYKNEGNGEARDRNETNINSCNYEYSSNANNISKNISHSQEYFNPYDDRGITFNNLNNLCLNEYNLGKKNSPTLNTMTTNMVSLNLNCNQGRDKKDRKDLFYSQAAINPNPENKKNTTESNNRSSSANRNNSSHSRYKNNSELGPTPTHSIMQPSTPNRINTQQHKKDALISIPSLNSNYANQFTKLFSDPAQETTEGQQTQQIQHISQPQSPLSPLRNQRKQYSYQKSSSSDQNESPQDKLLRESYTYSVMANNGWKNYNLIYEKPRQLKQSFHEGQQVNLYTKQIKLEKLEGLGRRAEAFSLLPDQFQSLDNSMQQKQDNKAQTQQTKYYQ